MAPVEEEYSSGERKVVCVTGASGYIASWIVKFLLQKGYTVRGSVRDLNQQWSEFNYRKFDDVIDVVGYDPKKTEHLLALDGAKERLHLFKADVMKDGSFDSAIDGCEGVFHTASPCYYTPQDPQTELLDPAVKGTLNVLGSCAKARSVRRVILTSSLAAMAIRKEPPTPDTVIDETWFSDPETCRASKLWYFLAKTLAEEAAWKFVKEKGIDMVTINPGYTIGPILQPTINFSVLPIYQLITEGKLVPNETSYWVNVKDVAEAHILAFEVPSAKGRYCMVESVLHYTGIVKILQELYPTLQLPNQCGPDGMETSCQVSKEKAKSLGIDFIPLRISLKETVESFKEKKLLSF